jgi:DNA-binding transcriptional LysR family regulator
MNATLSLRKLNYVVVVGHEMHFRRAADRLHITQPSLSRQIREFEQELGFEIFRRDRHLVALTDAGRAFVLAAEEIMTRLDADFKRARDISRLISRRNAASFLIGYSAFVPSTIRHEIRSIQRLRFPSIHLQFRMAITSEMLDSVSSGVFQAAVTFAPLERNDLQQIPLRSAPLHAISVSGHSSNPNHAIRLTDLRSRPLIVTSSDRTHPALYQPLLEQCATAGFKPNIVEEATSAQEAFDLVQDGVGIAIMPGGICDGMHSALQCSPIIGIEPLQLVFLYRRGGSQRVQRIAREIADSLRRASLEKVS